MDCPHFDVLLFDMVHFRFVVSWCSSCDFYYAQATMPRCASSEGEKETRATRHFEQAG
jgi:hypothetical protein